MTNTKLRELKKSELDKILEKHELWMCGDESGECANLTEANLKGSDLTEADLTRAKLTCARLNEANLEGAKLEEERA